MLAVVLSEMQVTNRNFHILPYPETHVLNISTQNSAISTLRPVQKFSLKKKKKKRQHLTTNSDLSRDFWHLAKISLTIFSFHLSHHSFISSEDTTALSFSSKAELLTQILAKKLILIMLDISILHNDVFYALTGLNPPS